MELSYYRSKKECYQSTTISLHILYFYRSESQTSKNPDLTFSWHRGQPDQTWTASTNPSFVPDHTESGAFGLTTSHRFESDFSTATDPPWTVAGQTNQASTQTAGLTAAQHDLTEAVQMGSFAVDDGHDAIDLHPDYLFERAVLESKAQQNRQESRMKNGRMRDNETGILINHTNPPLQVSNVDGPDGDNQTYAAIAPKKPKRKTTVRRADHRDPPRLKQNQDSCHMTSEGASVGGLVQSNTEDVQEGVYKSHVDGDSVNPKTCQEDIGLINGAEGSRDDNNDQGDRKDYPSGFGTSVTQILGRKPRFEKCMSYDEAAMMRDRKARPSLSEQMDPSEWPPIRKAVSGIEKSANISTEQDSRYREIPTSGIYKGVFNLSEIGRELEDDHRSDFSGAPKNYLNTNVYHSHGSQCFDFSRNSSLDSTPAPASPVSPHLADGPHYDSISPEHGRQSEAEAAPLPTASPTSPTFSFLSKATNRILARREVLKRHRSLGSVVPDENEGRRFDGDQRSAITQQDPLRKRNHSDSDSANALNTQHLDPLKKSAALDGDYKTLQIRVTDGSDNTYIRENGSFSLEEPGSYFRLTTPLYSHNVMSDPGNQLSLSDKIRRASAPDMEDKSPQFSNISPAFRRRIFKSISSDGLGGDDIAWRSTHWGNLPENQRSWSDDFYDLVMRSGSSDPEKSEYFKKLIDDRYEALFSKKYPGLKLGGQRGGVDGPYKRLGATDNQSPRTVKRRSAATRQKRLSRESSPNPSPYGSTDTLDSVDEYSTRASNGAQERTDHLRVPDQSQWKILYRPSLLSGPERPGLADGTDGADSVESSGCLTSIHPKKDPQKAQVSSRVSRNGIPEHSDIHENNIRTGDRMANEYASIHILNAQADVKDGKNDLRFLLQNEEKHVYSEVQGSQSDRKRNGSSDTKSYLSETVHEQASADTHLKEPIYESIVSLQGGESQESNASSDQYLGPNEDNLDMPYGLSDYAAKNIYDDIDDLSGQPKEGASIRFHNADGSVDTVIPELPPSRSNIVTSHVQRDFTHPDYIECKTQTFPTKQVYNADMQGVKLARLKRNSSGQYRPRSLTSSDTTSYHAPLIFKSTNLNKPRRKERQKIGRMDRHLFSPKSQGKQRQISLKKARKFSTPEVELPDRLAKRNSDFSGWEAESQQKWVRGRAQSLPAQPTDSVWGDLDLACFRSTAGDIILEHSLCEEDTPFDDCQSTNPSLEQSLSTEGHVVRASSGSNDRPPERLNYFGLDKTLMENLQKSSV